MTKNLKTKITIEHSNKTEVFETISGDISSAVHIGVKKYPSGNRFASININYGDYGDYITVDERSQAASAYFESCADVGETTVRVKVEYQK